MTTDLAICDSCGLECGEDELNTCALSTPLFPRDECDQCQAECGPCQDDAAIERQAEHGITSMRRS